MKLQFTKLEEIICFSADQVVTLQIEDRQLFSRVISSLISEEGEEAIEPYRFWENDEKKISPKRAVLVINTLPALPLMDRVLLGKLYEHISSALEQDIERTETSTEISRQLIMDCENLNTMLWGTYSFNTSWSLATFLKAFCFGPSVDQSESILDNFISFFGLCADINFNKPLVLVNMKSFFNKNELEALFEQAIFYGIELLLLESWNDETQYRYERKLVVDQGFVENWM